MPLGTPYNSFALPYPIRVDAFTSNLPPSATPALHFLTHTHSDHITGLSSKSFASTVICSHDAKQMLLRHEVYNERALFEQQLRSQKVRTFEHLIVHPTKMPGGELYYNGSRDLLKPLPLNTPTVFHLTNNESVTITLVDANHCPGAVMFLIEGSKGAVLHTGDFRAEPHFLDTIKRNPYLQPYLAATSSTAPISSTPISKTLETIYLDTACLLSSVIVPTKEQATSGLVEMMDLLPRDVHFFINSWTWGYEDVLKAVSRHFGSKIHVDRYKHSIYTHISDPFLQSILTLDATSTRFHACERFNRCTQVAVDDPPNGYGTTSRSGKEVVYVNMVRMDVTAWQIYIADVKRKIGRGERIQKLRVPLERHSPLPELQAFVKLFRPKSVVPNTLIPTLHGLDWLCMDRMFAAGVSSPSMSLQSRQIDIEEIKREVPLDFTTEDEDGDPSLQNLVGDDGAAVRRAGAEITRPKTKVEEMKMWFERGSWERMVVDGLRWHREEERAVVVGVGRVGKRRYSDSDEETDEDEDDEKGRTAHVLFAEVEDTERHCVSSSVSPDRISSSSPLSMKIGSKRRRHSTPTPCLGSPIPLSAKSSPSSATIPQTTYHPIVGPSKTKVDVTMTPPMLPLVDVHNIRTTLSSSQQDEPLPKRKRQRSPFMTGSSGVPVDKSSLSVTTSPRRRNSPPESQRIFTTENIPLIQTSNAVSPNGQAQRKEEEERRALRIQRLRITEKLCRARPDLVSSSYPIKRARLLSRHLKAEVSEQYLTATANLSTPLTTDSVSFTTTSAIDDDDAGMNWERSRELEDSVKEGLKNGVHMRLLLPTLSCVESQSQ